MGRRRSANRSRLNLPASEFKYMPVRSSHPRRPFSRPAARHGEGLCAGGGEGSPGGGRQRTDAALRLPDRDPPARGRGCWRGTRISRRERLSRLSETKWPCSATEQIRAVLQLSSECIGSERITHSKVERGGCGRRYFGCGAFLSVRLVLEGVRRLETMVLGQPVNPREWRGRTPRPRWNPGATPLPCRA
jgi:hypothetical protein